MQIPYMEQGSYKKFQEDLFQLTNENYLIPTSEVPLANYVRDQILKEEDLLICLTAALLVFVRNRRVVANIFEYLSDNINLIK